MPFSQDEYIAKAKSNGHSQEFIDITVAYAQNLVAKNLPVIFTTEHLSSILDIPILELSILINQRNKWGANLIGIAQIPCKTTDLSKNVLLRPVSRPYFINSIRLKKRTEKVSDK